MRTWSSTLLRFSAFVGAVALALYAFVFDVWTVPTDDPKMTASIAPTLSAGDVLLVERHGTISRGNLLRCADPQAPGRFVVARAIGRAGDHLAIEKESVVIDGQHTPSPHVCNESTYTVFDPDKDAPVTLSCAVEAYGNSVFSALRGNDHFEPTTKAVVDAETWFLVSDNRHIHVDSRDYGALRPAVCQRIVFRIVGPAGFGDPTGRLSIIW